MECHPRLACEAFWDSLALAVSVLQPAQTATEVFQATGCLIDVPLMMWEAASQMGTQVSLAVYAIFHFKWRIVESSLAEQGTEAWMLSSQAVESLHSSCQPSGGMDRELIPTTVVSLCN